MIQYGNNLRKKVSFIFRNQYQKIFRFFFRKLNAEKTIILLLKKIVYKIIKINIDRDIMKCYTNKFNSLNTNRLGNHTSASNKLIMISINKLCDRFKKINLFYHCYSNKSIPLPNPHSSYRS